MLFGAAESMGIKANLAVLQALQTQIDVIEKALSKHCRGNPGYRLLKTVSGIGPILATVILLETGSIERFADVGNYASYCRRVGSVHVSNGKKERRRQHKEWKSLSGLGIRRSRQFCNSLLRTGAKILSTQESQTQQHCCHQGGSTQAGARLLPHAEDWRAVLNRALLYVKLGNGRQARTWVGLRAIKIDWTSCSLPLLFVLKKMNRPTCEPQGSGTAMQKP